jgi:hypothetical protein
LQLSFFVARSVTRAFRNRSGRRLTPSGPLFYVSVIAAVVLASFVAAVLKAATESALF